MDKNNRYQLLILLAPQELKDNLVDTLISHEALSGFSLSKIQGYSRAHHQYNIQEQVEGYRDLFRFEVLHEQLHYQELLTKIKQTCPNNNIRYWCVPVIEKGVL